ncbi:hypothetical protein [Xanthomonas sp. NCPPB 2632]|uniref:hypothetical protein n=1 Tax=Xanthomonas sp. NCPPB 2632 TaxID=3240912 RepID=UPI0035141221
MEKTKENFILRLWTSYGLLVDFDGEPRIWKVVSPSARKGGPPKTWRQFVEHVLGNGVENVRLIVAREPDPREAISRLGKEADCEIVDALRDEATKREAARAQEVRSRVLERLEAEKLKAKARREAAVERVEKRMQRTIDKLEIKLSRALEQLEAHEADRKKMVRRRMSASERKMDGFLLDLLADWTDADGPEAEQADREWAAQLLTDTSRRPRSSEDLLAVLMKRMASRRPLGPS